MLHLKTFGGLSVDIDGIPATGAAQQRKTLGLLALLSVAGQRGLSRDKLIASLWPETDAEHGRGLLRQACYALRRDLHASDLFLGSIQLRLNPDVISSDVESFVGALEQNEPSRAVSCYTAPFLDGFYLNGGGEFEEWAETERARLASQYRAALEVLAAEATGRGEHRMAAEWWRRLLELDPMSSQAALGLMTALDHAGQRAEALRCGLSYGELVRAELGYDPPAELSEWIEQHRRVAGNGVTGNGVESIVLHALAKDASQRYQSASEISHDASGVLAHLSGAAPLSGNRSQRPALAYVVPATIATVLLTGIGGWFYLHVDRRHWARDEAIPEIAKLNAADKSLAAFLLLKKAERYLPADSDLAHTAQANTRIVSIASSPPGAAVDIQDYVSPDTAWYHLGTTPLKDITIPAGYFRWRLSNQGVGAYLTAPATEDEMTFALDSARISPDGMVWVRGGPFFDYIDFVGWVGPYDLPPFYIDRFEVTNRQYQKFVDSSGYQRRKYWDRKFMQGGRELRWDQAMPLFRDRTGRAGPSTWEGGHYPEEQADYPVSGISWYEASAYAAFVGKSLPTLAQWYRTAPPEIAPYIVQTSNITRSTLAPVGAFKGIGPYGTYDMAGNVREWTENALDADRRFILGGTWRSPTYLYANPEALSPFDRSPANGVRCLTNTAPLPPEVSRPVKTLERDFSRARPASDEVFRAYQVLYAYDKTPLNAKVEGVVQDSRDWREEKITFDAAYGNERVPAYLYLPKNVRPPYQTIVFFPSARVLHMSNSRTLGDTAFFDYIIQSGRAVLYPIYQNTYERRVKTVLPGASQHMELTVQRFKDLGRSLDYLQTRDDIDNDRLAYLGVSMGTAEGVIYTTLVQDRLRTVVFLDGGFFLGRALPGRDQVDFAPRLKKPVLMVNGRYDFTFSLDKSQIPLFRMLGTPSKDKRHIVLESPHDVTARRAELVKAVLGWLDEFLGRVQ